MNKFNYSVTNQQLSPKNNSIDQRITTAQQKHNVNDYGLLNNAIAQHTKKAKKKKVTKASLQIYSDRQHHCQSLDKLTFLHQQKNQQIRNYIYQKAALQAQNEELKLNLLSPTVRQNQLYTKIQQLQVQITSLTQQLQDKQKRHRKQIEQLKSKHSAQLASVHQTYYKQKIYVQPSNVKYYQPFKGRDKQISPPKQVIRTFQNDKRLVVENSNNLISKNHRFYPESKENILKVNSYSTTSQTHFKPVQLNQKQTIANNNSGYQNVFIKTQTISNTPIIYSMSPNFVRESDSPKKNTPDTTKNTTQNFNYAKNQHFKREQLIPLKSQNVRIKQVSPQYRNNIYTYEKVQSGEPDYRSNGLVIGPKIQKQEKNIQNNSSKHVFKTANEKPSVQVGNVGVSDKQIDEIYKRYYLHDK